MFGKIRRRKALVMELAEQRMRLFGVDDRTLRLELKKMGTLQTMGLPEAAIVTVVEIAVTNQKRGILLPQTLRRLEDTRKISGANAEISERILQQASGPNPAAALTSYSLYRIKLENKSIGPLFDLDITSELVGIAYQEISSW